jgi:outer membrane protein
LEVTKARAAFLPTVSVTLSHSAGNLQYLNNQVSVNTAENTNSFRQGTANVAMLQVSIPLFDGLSTVSREREARAQKEKARADLDDARLEAETREKQIYLDLSSAFAREHTLADALKSSELALASNRAAYEVGLRINSDVLRAEDTVYATQRDLAHSRYEIVLDHLRLRANAGVLSLNDLRTVDALLVPAAGDGSLEAARILTGINDKQ